VRILHHPANAGNPRDISNLVGIGNEPRRAMGHNKVRTRRWRQHHALNVHMRIDEPRNSKATCRVDHLARACVVARTHDRRDPSAVHND
jgi:hypothetical protein